MKIDFTQIYSEPGASFDLPGPLLGAISDGLDRLGRHIQPLSEKFGGNNFDLVLIISARHKLEELEVKGPNVRRKAREVEFSFFLPWRETEGFEQTVEYVLPHIGDGVCAVFERYGVQTGGVRAVMETVLEEVKKAPSKFQYPPRGHSG